MVAGSFYPSDSEVLRRSIEACFKHPVGPGELPSSPDFLLAGKLSLVVPHAGYVFSGPVASWAYLEASKRGKPRKVVLIGPNHTGIGEMVAVYPEGIWKTPMGTLKVDEEMVKLLLKESDFLAPDFNAHLYEHSLEVQLPFLQYIYGDEFTIIPITMMDQSLNTARKLAKLLETLLPEGTLLIASSDMDHYDDHETACEKDEKVIAAILENDMERMYNLMREYDITVCGYGPIAVLISMSHEKVKLLKHATSGDTGGDRKRVVGYASFVIE